MPTIAKRLHRGTVGITTVNAYTVPNATTTIIKSIVLTNKSTANANITILVSGTELIYQYDISAKDTVTLDLSVVMHATESITMIASAANSVNVYISGVEVTI